MKRLKSLKPYRFEIIVAALAIIAIFLLLGDDSHNAVRGFVTRMMADSLSFFERIREALGVQVRDLTPADFVAIGLLFVVFGLIYWRVRWRIWNAPKLNVHVCPLCGSKLHRVQRKQSDRILGAVLILSLRRYKCVHRQCGWSGLVTSKSRQIELEAFTE